jgi:hypothetical protein
MSIEDSIRAHVADQRPSLFEYRPLLDSDQSPCRRLLLTPFIHNWLSQTPSAMREINRISNAKAKLTAFHAGEEMVEGDDLKKLQPHYNDIWAFRLMSNPLTRVAGGFCMQDCFVALVWRDRLELGDGESREWKAIMTKAIAKWDELFPGYRRYRGQNLSDCIS